MSTEVGAIHFDLDLDHRKFSQGVKSVDNDTNTLHKGFSLAKAGAVALAAGVAVAAASVVAFGVSSVKAYNESLEAQTKLSTNLLNVKGNTDANVKSIQNLASAMQKKGVIDDDVIVAGAAQLATFNLQGKTIETLTPKIGDMVAQLKGSNATAEDAVGINNLIGKVMTGNVGALSRYGVTLDENQKKQLKNGNEAERAALLVKVLGQNYGNINEELSKTPQGQLTMLKNRFGELQEQVGEVLVKGLVPVMDFVMDHIIPSFESLWNTVVMLFSGDFKGGIFGLSEDAPFISAVFTFRETLISIWEWISTKLWPAFLRLLPTLITIGKTIGNTLINAFKGLVTIVKWMIDHLDIMVPIIIGLATAGLVWLAIQLYVSAAAAWANAVAWLAWWWPIIAIGVAIAAVVAALIYAYTHWKTFRTVVDTVIKAIKTAALWLWNNVLQPVFKAIGWYITNVLVPQFKIIWSVVQTVFNAIAAVIKWVWETIIKPVWDILYWYVTSVLIPGFQLVWSIVGPIFGWIGGKVKEMWETAQPYIQKLKDIWEDVRSAMETAWKWIEENIMPIIKRIADVIGGVTTAVKDFVNAMKGTGKETARNLPGKSNPNYNPDTGSSGHAVASGGFIKSRTVNLVGEKGPELFMPASSGQIIDAQRTAQLMSEAMGSSGGNVYLSIDASGIMATSRAHQRQVISTLIEAANEELIARGIAPIADNKLRAAV